MAKRQSEVEIRLERLERALSIMIRYGALMLPPNQIKQIENILNGTDDYDS